ncbi:MAG: RpiB/LacA/LacB family sugar-phosphate isomerase [Candidatus Doudnabacteria bacterium]|nr:RpiB/LacA/LacB family sugar-phosphate isomerase [Candidatus Doudnabacteria bacterium]
MLYIASDHGGFQLKEFLKANLVKEGGRVTDLGPQQLDPEDDYPDFAKKVAGKVSRTPDTDFGILICRSGQGMCIAANKFKGVRAGLVWNVKEAKASRTDDHTNILCLPSDYIKPVLAQKIVQAWLDTPWSKEKRHIRRVKKVNSL